MIQTQTIPGHISSVFSRISVWKGLWFIAELYVYVCSATEGSGSCL